jgi:hypothetical protein
MISKKIKLFFILPIFEILFITCAKISIKLKIYNIQALNYPKIWCSFFLGITYIWFATIELGANAKQNVPFALVI